MDEVLRDNVTTLFASAPYYRLVLLSPLISDASSPPQHRTQNAQWDDASDHFHLQTRDQLHRLEKRCALYQST